MILDTSNSLNVDFVTGGSTGIDWRSELRPDWRVTTGSGVGVDDAELLEGFLESAEAPGVDERMAGSQRRGDSCEVD